MTTPPEEQRVDVAFLKDFDVEESLYALHYPLIFTLRALTGQLLLAYTADEDESGSWLILSATTSKTIDALKAGQLTVRGAISQGWTWLTRLRHDETWDGVWSIPLADLPERYLPASDAMLYAHLQPAIVVKLEGAAIPEGRTPASVVKFGAESVPRAIKTLLDHGDLGTGAIGRPTDLTRQLYDVSVQQIRYGSLEISFAPPSGLLKDPSLLRAVELLNSGLSWLTLNDAAPVPGATPLERQALLKALKHLTPPSTGAIERVVLSGQWVKVGPTTFGRAARRRVQAAVRRVKTEQPMLLTGRIGEIDIDRQTFKLRDVGDQNMEWACTLSEDDSLDEALTLFQNQDHVDVLGMARDGIIYVLLLEKAGPVNDSDE